MKSIINTTGLLRTLFEKLLLLAVFFASSRLSPLRAQPADPDLRWRSLQTPHFDIHYHEPLGWSARRVAAICERLHTNLSRFYRTSLRQRTQVVLDDETDTANGSATVLPYNLMRLYVTAPEDMSVLSDYDDWLTSLIAHEYTHILQLDQTSGFPALLNTIFGKNFAPNQLEPRWFIEGMAVHEESEHTAGGRIRSTMFRMYLRMDALAHRLMRIDQLSSGADRWPHGNAWYLYGAFFAHFMAEKGSGTSALTRFASEYGDNVIPYGLNRDAKRSTGRSFISWYDAFLNDVKQDAQATLEKVVREGRIEGMRITWHGEEVRAPRFIDNHHVIYFSQNNSDRPYLRTASLAPERFPIRANPCAPLVRVKDMVVPSVRQRKNETCPQIVFSGVDVHRNLYLFRDLFEIKGKHVMRLTEGARAAEPDLHPQDPDKVVYTLTSAGSSHLAVAKLSDIKKTQKILLRSRRYDQVYTPRWSPDGRYIAVSTWSQGGYRDIELIDAVTGKREKITDDRALDTGPAWSPQGDFLYFSSDRTGIANIYAYHLRTHKTFQVTNVVGGAYQPDIAFDGKHLVYVGYTTFGFDLFVLPISVRSFRDAPPYKDVRPMSSDHEEVMVLPSDRYDPLPSFRPRAVQLDLIQDAFGPQFGISTRASDAIERHIAAARLGIGSRQGNVAINAQYTLRLSPLRLRISSFRTINPRTGFNPGGPDGLTAPSSWIEQATGATLGLDYTYTRRFDRFSFFVNHSLTYTTPHEALKVTYDPNFRAPSVPRTGLLPGVSLGWQYSNVERYLYDISSHRGFSLGASLGWTRPFFIGDQQTTSLTWNFSRFFPLTANAESHWLRSRMAVLALQYRGGINLGSLTRRAAFGVGGFSSVPLSDAIMSNLILGGTALRGYRPFDRFGDQYHLLQTEIRFLVARLNRGISTLPVYFNRMYANVFVDCGDAFVGTLAQARLRFGTGAELFFDFTAAYILPYTLRLGFARGLSEGGQTQVYMHLGLPF